MIIVAPLLCFESEKNHRSERTTSYWSCALSANDLSILHPFIFVLLGMTTPPSSSPVRPLAGPAFLSRFPASPSHAAEPSSAPVSGTMALFLTATAGDGSMAPTPVSHSIVSSVAHPAKNRHVEFVLVAEFDIDRGPTMKCQYPHNTGVSEG